MFIDTYDVYSHPIIYLFFILVQTNYTNLNRRARIFGILFLEDNREILNGLLDCRSADRKVFDNLENRKQYIFNEIAVQVNNNAIVVAHPRGWVEGVQIKKGENLRKRELSKWVNLNPNYHLDETEKITGLSCAYLFKQTLNAYKQAMRSWTKGTGGGPGAPMNYCDWESRENVLFANYTFEFKEVLTWIYMWDRMLQGPLKGAVELLEDGFETGLKDPDVDSVVSESTSSKRSKTSNKSADTMVDKIVEKINISAQLSFNEAKKIMQDVSQSKKDDEVAETSNIIQLITAMDTMKQKLKAEINESTDTDLIQENENHIKTLQKRIRNMYKKLRDMDD